MPRFGYTVQLPDGTYARVCSSSPPAGRCKACGNPTTALCDFPLTGKRKSKTCSAKLCAGCSVQLKPSDVEQLSARGIVLASPDAVDLCLPHARHLGLG